MVGMSDQASSTAPDAAFPSVFPRDLEYLRSKVPPRDADLTASVGQPVTITWDRWGLAHIRGATRHDLSFGLGYATAQECLWRLDYQRRQARGTLAAMLGPDALASDRTMRLIGLGPHADSLVTDLPENVAQSLAGLTAGINRWIEQAIEAKTLPVEFDWLGYEPAPWAVADSIACWKHRWWTLTGRLDNIAIGEAARRYLPAELHAAFMAVELGDETIVPAEAYPPGVGKPTVQGGHDTGEGSNNWVVSGARTTTGYPVLCSDPHNPFGQPGQWFQAQLVLEDGSLDVAGAVYAGSLGPYMGRNRRVAWGFTNHVASVRDLYVETVDPQRPDHYQENGGWRPFQMETAEIEVRGAPLDRYLIRRTTRGPLVDSLLPSLGAPPTGAIGGPISLRWAGTDVGTGMDALLALHASRSAAAAVAAMEAWVCPIANLLVADTEGHIAYHAVGRVPHRTVASRAYCRADNPAQAWQGFIPYSAMPQDADPAQGWLASANQPPWPHDPPGLAYLGSAAWADGWRMRRIRVRLTGDGVDEAPARFSPEQIGTIQADVTSARAVELLPHVVAAAAGSESPVARQAGDLLQGWDGKFTLDTPAASLWVAFWEHWQRRVSVGRFPQGVASLVQSQAGAVARQLLLGQDTSPPWFGAAKVASLVADALVDAVAWISNHFGADPAAWRWGTHHTVTWQHPFSTHGPDTLRRAAREVLDVGPFPTTGGVGTVRAAGVTLTRPFEVTGGSTYRLVADLSPGGGLQATTTTGQSGHPGSPHYADQVPLWLEDRYHPFPADSFEPEGVTTIRPR